MRYLNVRYVYNEHQQYHIVLVAIKLNETTKEIRNIGRASFRNLAKGVKMKCNGILRAERLIA